mgnify:FL=1
MEKKKEEIVESVKIIDTELYDYENDYYNESDDFEEKEHWNEDENEQYLFETAFAIHNNLLDYVNSFALPLCEKLDVDSIIEFIKKTS